MHHRGQPIDIESLPRNHRELRGVYQGQSEDGCPFQLHVQHGSRQASGNQLMRAQVTALRRGRPMTPSDMRVEYDEIFLLVGRSGRMDIRLNPNGSYSHGNVFGRDLREIVTNMITTFAPRFRPVEREREDEDTRTPSPKTGPKPF
jgi:hypothetical protein